MTTNQTEPTRVRPFADFLAEQAKGTTHEELSDALRDLVRRVTDTGKKGVLTYSVEVAPMKGADGMLVVQDKIVLKLPEHDRQASLYFSDEDSNLVKDDPRQISFESLREVPAGVNAATGEIKTLPSQPTAREMGGKA